MLTEIHDIAIYVHDQDKAIAFYRDKLGFELRSDSVLPTGLRWVEVSLPDNKIVLALLVPFNPDDPTQQPGNGDTGVCLVCDDVAATVREFKERGVDVNYEENAIGAYFQFRDLDGNQFVVANG